jgi:hypothetical protein
MRKGGASRTPCGEGPLPNIDLALAPLRPIAPGKARDTRTGRDLGGRCGILRPSSKLINPTRRRNGCWVASLYTSVARAYSGRQLKFSPDATLRDPSPVVCDTGDEKQTPPSTIRSFDARRGVWWVVWQDPLAGEFAVLVGGREGDSLALEGQWTLANRQPFRWTFSGITSDSFEWSNEVADDGGAWRLRERFVARRRQS